MKRRKFIASGLLGLLAASRAQAAPAKKSARSAARSVRRKSVVSAEKPPVSDESPRVRNFARLPEESPSQWRDYEFSAVLSGEATTGPTRLWLPLPQYRDTAWMCSSGYRWQGNFETAGIYRDPRADLEAFCASWPADVAAPRLEIVSRFSTQDRRFDITRRNTLGERGEILRRCLEPSESMPLDGVVQRLAEKAIGRIKDPLAQAKAIYDWVVENTVFDPQAPGSVRLDALSGNERFTGQSADISCLFVALCRAIGIPARPVFGLRIDESRLFAGLAASGEFRDDRHCRAEFHSPGYGWVPVDPSDVRRAILTENLESSDPRRNALKKLLFGFWEMNWIAFNTALDVSLGGGGGETLGFFDTPIVETDGVCVALRGGEPSGPGGFGYRAGARRV